jgi:hypothetical protein
VDAGSFEPDRHAEPREARAHDHDRFGHPFDNRYIGEYARSSQND